MIPCVYQSDMQNEKNQIQRDYTVADIIALTGYSSKRIAGLKLHGQYYIGGKRLFRKEVVDDRRRRGLNLAETGK